MTLPANVAESPSNESTVASPFRQHKKEGVKDLNEVMTEAKRRPPFERRDGGGDNGPIKRQVHIVTQTRKSFTVEIQCTAWGKSRLAQTQ